MSPPLRLTMNLAAGVALVATLLLGGTWLSDRTHRWEAPRWERGRFVLLREGPGPARPGGSRWVMALNPRCPHCMGTLMQLRSVWARRGKPEDLVALIVDTPAAPGAATLRSIPCAEVWWDREGVWRRRWGHRLYGELIEFDDTGRGLRTLAPQEIIDRRSPPAPGAPSAPAREEGR